MIVVQRDIISDVEMWKYEAFKFLMLLKVYDYTGLDISEILSEVDIEYINYYSVDDPCPISAAGLCIKANWEGIGYNSLEEVDNLLEWHDDNREPAPKEEDLELVSS